MKSFNELGIIEPILKSIEENHFKEPTLIQEKSIPLIIDGKDVIGMSSTGSGKTLAFGCGIIQNSERNQGVQALILTPTRELAEQVSEAIKDFSKHKKLKLAAIYGGVSYNPQIENMKIAEIVVATPGRLLDHIERRTIDLSNVKTLVLDEADRMLDMGFIHDVKKIISICPEKRQTLLFSATISGDIKEIVKRHMKDPVTVSVSEFVDPTKLKQSYYDVRNEKKLSLLVTLLEKDHYGSIIVFCNTRRQVDFIEKNLRSNKIDALAIHGGLTQSKRMNSLDRFQKEGSFVLVCTDVAARGLDIPGVSHVYNYDMPNDPKEYIHRIGRTARAGRDGEVINLISERDHDNFSNTLNRNRKLNIEKMELPEIKKIFAVKQETGKRRFNKPSFFDKNKDQKRSGPRRGNSGRGGRNKREN